MALYPLLDYRRTGAAVIRKGEFVGFENVLPIGAMVTSDIPMALELWQRTNGVGLAIEETPQMLAAFLERTPAVSSITGIGDCLVGAVLDGHDGRRGYLYHISVEPKHRGCGLARSLVDRTVFHLGSLGLHRATIMVYATNAEEAFVASVAACHMLWFLHVAIDAGFEAMSYDDQAIGEMMTDSGASFGSTA